MKLEEVLKIHVLYTIQQYKTRKEAAKVLGISIRTLRNYLNDWGLGFEDRQKIDVKYEEIPSYKSLTASERDKFENMDRY